MALNVVIASPTGGTGRSTLVAQLTRALAHAGRRCFAVDLDPQNSLSLLLSRDPAAQLGRAHGELGLVHAELSAATLADSWRTRRAQVAYLPFGVHEPAQRRQLERSLSARPELLAERLAELCPVRTELVLLDTPAGASCFTDAALALADLVLVLLAPEPVCAASLPSYETYLRAQAPSAYPHSVYYLFSRFDPTRALAADIIDALSAPLRERLLTRVIHEDEALREQLARGDDSALGAATQAALDYAYLARFISGALDERSPARAEVARAVAQT